jgi:hypothetical protein
MNNAFEMALGDMIFTTICSGIQVILGYYIYYLKGYNIGNTDGRDLWSAPLMTWYNYQVSWRLVKAFK